MKTKKLIINNLSFEMTRQCQLSCMHCLRGPSQKKYRLPNLIALNDFLKNIDYVSSLTLTGGEPTLTPMAYYSNMINIFTRNHVDIGSFYIATNGLCLLKPQTEMQFYQLISFLYVNCDDNEVSGIKFSRDNFHKQELSFEKNQIIDAKIDKFTKLFDDNFVYVDDRDSNLINEGNAKKHKIGDRENSVYLEIDDNVIAGCDWSYRNQDRSEHIISNAQDFNLQTCWNYQVIHNQTN